MHFLNKTELYVSNKLHLHIYVYGFWFVCVYVPMFFSFCSKDTTKKIYIFLFSRIQYIFNHLHESANKSNWYLV